MAREAHERKAAEDCEFFVRHLLNQWPCEVPHCQLPSRTYCLDINAAYARILPEWTQLYMNRELSLHLDMVQAILNYHSSEQAFPRLDFRPSDAEFPRPANRQGLPLLTNVLTSLGNALLGTRASDGSRATPSTNATVRKANPPRRANGKRQITDDSARAIREISSVIKDLSMSKSLVQQKYATDLERSLDAFASHESEQPLVRDHEVTRTLRSLNLRTMRLLEALMADVTAASHDISGQQIRCLMAGQLWPVVSPVTLLEQLRSSRDIKLEGPSKMQILEYALSVTELQRAIRMEKHEKAGDSVRWREEQANPGHSMWDPAQYPDWILLEIESDILIRDGQFEVAQAIIAPQSGKCSVLQLNMGQGKTSCIIPMVATVLADGENLVRVCVPKALLQQTAQLVQTRLGGLVGRRTGHVPFSRKTPTDEATIKQFQRLHVVLQKDREYNLRQHHSHLLWVSR